MISQEQTRQDASATLVALWCPHSEQCAKCEAVLIRTLRKLGVKRCIVFFFFCVRESNDKETMKRYAKGECEMEAGQTMVSQQWAFVPLRQNWRHLDTGTEKRERVWEPCVVNTKTFRMSNTRVVLTHRNKWSSAKKIQNQGRRRCCSFAKTFSTSRTAEWHFGQVRDLGDLSLLPTEGRINFECYIQTTLLSNCTGDNIRCSIFNAQTRRYQWGGAYDHTLYWVVNSSNLIWRWVLQRHQMRYLQKIAKVSSATLTEAIGQREKGRVV